MQSLEDDLAQARAVHGGHLCHGMVLGVRMARCACILLGIGDPRHYCDLVVYVEMDRCASDAISAVTGVTLGRRRLKWVDYGKFAATFVDLATDRAVRLAARPETPHGRREDDAEEIWRGVSDEALFCWDWVRIDVAARDRPGRPTERAWCAVCGEKILDGRGLHYGDTVLCTPCATEPYYEVIRADEGQAAVA